MTFIKDKCLRRINTDAEINPTMSFLPGWDTFLASEVLIFNKESIMTYHSGRFVVKNLIETEAQSHFLVVSCG